MAIPRFLHSLWVFELKSLFLGNNYHTQTLIYKSVGGDERGRQKNRETETEKKEIERREIWNTEGIIILIMLIILSIKAR